MNTGDLKRALQWLAHEMFKAYLRYFPIRRGKERILRRLWKPLVFGKYRRSARLKAIPVQVDCDLTQWIQRHLYFFGEYEPERTYHWMRLAVCARAIFDVGANVGTYSLAAASVNPRAIINAFEPSPDLFELLCANARNNDLQNITAHQVAVAEVTGVAFLHCCQGIDGANEGMNYVSSARERDSDVEIKRISLDDFCKQHRLSEIDLLKMDIEGNEYAALLGAKDLLGDKRIHCMFLEVNNWALARAGSSPTQIKDLLQRAGYNLFTVANKRVVRADAADEIPEILIAFSEDSYSARMIMKSGVLRASA